MRSLATSRGAASSDPSCDLASDPPSRPAGVTKYFAKLGDARGLGVGKKKGRSARMLNIGKLAAGQQSYYLDLARVDDYYTGQGEAPGPVVRRARPRARPRGCRRAGGSHRVVGAPQPGDR